jgi:trehalose synthase
VSTRWLVIEGSPDFFRVTKRLHHALHGEPGDRSELDERATGIYEQVMRESAAELDGLIRAGDIAILHDPQTAGLIPGLVERGVGVVWRCHVGTDNPGPEDAAAWKFLEAYLKRAHAFVFSRFSYLPEQLYHGRCMVVPPAIDPFSAKNQMIAPPTVQGILNHAGLIAGPAVPDRREFVLTDGTRARVERRAEVMREGPPPRPDTPLIVQVSRWDGMKDPIGVLHGFLRSLDNSPNKNAELVLAGPSVDADPNDSEAREVFRRVVAVWQNLTHENRRRVHLVNLPVDDLQENAAMINALQRHAAVIVQKSMREAFGLTVTEAMWKSRPVVASAVGGIRDQIEHGVSGLLLRNPTDLDALAGAINRVLDNPGFAERLGRNAQRRVSQSYLGLDILNHYDDLIERMEYELRDRVTA